MEILLRLISYYYAVDLEKNSTKSNYNVVMFINSLIWERKNVGWANATTNIPTEVYYIWLDSLIVFCCNIIFKHIE